MDASPPLPDGWSASWSPQHGTWFYFHAATNTSQWQPPTNLAFPPSPPIQNSGLEAPVPTPDDGTEPQDRGLMGTALGVGGGMLAGSMLGHKIHEFTHHHHHQHEHHGIGNLGSVLGAAGAGALGAKLAGFFGNKHSSPPPPPPPSQTVVVAAMPVPQYQPPYQGYPSSPPPSHIPPAVGSPPAQAPPQPNQLASTGDAGMFMAGVAASPYQHQHQGYQQAPPPVAGPLGPPLGPIGYNGPPLYVQAAIYGDIDVTQKVRALVDSQQQLVIKKGTFKDKLGEAWPEVEIRSLFVLYQYGNRPMEVMIGSDNYDVYQIKHESLSKAAMSCVNSRANSRVVSLLWGKESVLTDSRLEQLEKDGEIDASRETLGNGGWYEWHPRVLVCFYHNGSGGIGIAAARQGGTVRLPWNPLAKWG